MSLAPFKNIALAQLMLMLLVHMFAPVLRQLTLSQFVATFLEALLPIVLLLHQKRRFPFF